MNNERLYVIEHIYSCFGLLILERPLKRITKIRALFVAFDVLLIFMDINWQDACLVCFGVCLVLVNLY